MFGALVLLDNNSPQIGASAAELAYGTYKMSAKSMSAVVDWVSFRGVEADVDESCLKGVAGWQVLALHEMTRTPVATPMA